jgi:23S rRNA pseudouridine2605 synthase
LTALTRTSLSQSDRVTLDRLFSKLGIASRGVSQKWIREGRVRIKGQLVKNPDIWVSWPSDSITLDGETLIAPQKRFFLFHKPKGYITTHSDEKGRKTVFDLLPKNLGFIHAVGRLDQATSGLLLLTNDSKLSDFLCDPIHKIGRIYLASVRGKFTETKAAQAKTGVTDQGELLKCENIGIQKSSERETHLELTLIQGKNKEVRRLLKVLGHEVTRLRRIQYGPFKLDELLPGEWKEIPITDVHSIVRNESTKIFR